MKLRIYGRFWIFSDLNTVLNSQNITRNGTTVQFTYHLWTILQLYGIYHGPSRRLCADISAALIYRHRAMVLTK